tara:strand:+ start:246 stop:605 length:360 start_codon:yes stop_codon:yes gene_type:complete
MSTLKVNTLEEATTGGATFYTAKAVATFDGKLNTIQASANVSSMTDHGSGQYTLNWQNNFGNINYTSTGMCGAGYNNESGVAQPRDDYVPTTSSCRYHCSWYNSQTHDQKVVMITATTV